MIKLLTINLLFFSLGLLGAGFYLKKSSREINEADLQFFLLDETRQIQLEEWGKYLNEKVSIDYKSEKLVEIQAIGVSYDRVSGLVNNFQLIKYAKLHRLKLQGDQANSSFSISAVLSLP
jgi:hypothetical protein